MLGKVFKAYDIRSAYPKPLNEKLAWQIGYGAAQFLVEQASDAGYDDPMMRHIVVGRDMRKSSPKLVAALKKGIRDFGAHAIDIGLVDTPMIYFAVNYLACCGGIQTTASHNPANYNGFKISQIRAKPVGSATGLDDIRRYAAMSDQEKVTPAGGREEQRDLWDAYREHVLRFLDPEIISGKKKLKVFRDVKGLKITRINFDNASGEFVHEPNPLVAANLQQTREAVRDQKADVGFCFDGDADRCMVVDEHGESIPCDHLTAWLATEILADHPGSAIVYDLRSTRALPELIKKHGGRPVRSRVGHVFMKQLMAENDAVFGGELSGHFYFRENFFADSGAIALAMVASSLARHRKKLSTLMKPVRKYAQSGEINFEVEDKDEALEELKEAYSQQGGSIDELDGVTIDMDTWWFNVRPSNTEPLLRMNVEGPNEESVRAKVEELASFLGEAVAH